MLSRTGNHLLRAARCLERAELMASFTRAQHLSAMDTPYPDHKSAIWDFLLKSFKLKQAYDATHAELEESQVLRFLAVGEANPSSIRATITQARELARGSRDSLSATLWEYINSFYHTIHAYTDEQLHQKGFGNFAQKVEKNSFTIKGYIDSLQIRNEEWKLLSVGFHLERAIVINSLVLYTMKAIADLGEHKQAQPIAEYHMRTMLECLDCYEVYKHYYKTKVNRQDFLGFVMLNAAFPRSVSFNLQCIERLTNKVDDHGTNQLENALLDQAATWVADISIEDSYALQGDTILFLEQTLAKLQNMAFVLEEEPLVNQP